MGHRTYVDNPLIPEDPVRATSTAARSRRDEAPTPEILGIYLREMGSTPLIEHDRELELARELQEARDDLVKLVRRLPKACRDHVLKEDAAGPRRGRDWPLDQVEAVYDRLISYRKSHGNSRLDATVRQASDYKRRIDRAREALTLANLRLVVHLAKKYVKHGVAFMDLIQEGNIGLLRAVEKFEWERGHKFSTYAYWWIKQALQRAIADKGRVIRLPVHVVEKVKKISTVSRELAELLGRKPTAREIARELEMDIEKVEELMDVVPDAEALEDGSAPEDRPNLLLLLPDPQALDPLERTREREIRQRVEESLRVLTPREEKIVRLRYGIGRDRSCTLEEIGRHLGLSRERVRQLEAIALRKVHAILERPDIFKLVG